MRKIIIPVVIMLIGVLISSSYIIEEGSKGVVVRFNKMIQLSEPGIHFKIPGVDKVRILDARIQTTNSLNSNEGKGKQFITKDKSNLVVDYFVQWKIVDFERYYKTISDGKDISSLILDNLNGYLQTEISQLDIKGMINNTQSDGSFMVKIRDLLNSTQQNNSENKKQSLDGKPSVDFDSHHGIKDFGVEIIDIRITQISFTPEMLTSIYKNTKNSQEAIARSYLAQGMKEAEDTRNDAKLMAIKILSEAKKQARSIQGEGDVNAAKLYADALNKNKEFFSFIRSLKAYEQSFSDNDIMVISPDSQFFRYMKLAEKKK